MSCLRRLGSLKLLVLAGCIGEPTSQDSCSPPISSTTGVPTLQLNPSMSAQSYGTGIHVYAAFTGGSGAITLGSGDALTVSENGGAPVALVQEAADGSRGPIHYTTTLPRNDMPADVVVAF